MDANRCDLCQERALGNKRGDAFNATANPLAPTVLGDGTMDEGVDDLGECSSSFRAVKSYFHVYLKRCRSCGAIWLLGYYEDFDAVDPSAEWGVRTWVWRPLAPEHIEQIEAASGTGALDIDTFAAALSSPPRL